MRTVASYPPGRVSTSLAVGRAAALAAIAAALFAPATCVLADDPQATADGTQVTQDALDEALKKPPTEQHPTSKPEPELRPFPAPPEGAKPLTKEGRAWMDRENKRVIVDARVSLRRGLLEMFACPPNTKEHESIVAVDSPAFVLHAGLLAVGAEPGTPVQFTPEYKVPTGTEIEIEVQWQDKDGQQHTARAQDWIRDARTKKPMALPWVFAGSGFWRDEETGDTGYLAEAGDLVCVANFSTAMLDVPAQLTSDNSGLLFEAYTERIPPLGWPVRLVFKPLLKDDKPRDEAPDPTQPKRDLQN